MTHVHSLHAKPFGSGVWHQVLKEALTHYRSTRDSTSPCVRFYGELWAIDVRRTRVDVRLDTDADWEALWDGRFAEMFDEKTTPVKMMRWFSSNERHEECGTSTWPLKLVLRHHNGTLNNGVFSECYMDPVGAIRASARSEMAALKASAGGLKVAERVLTMWTHFHIRV